MVLLYGILVDGVEVHCSFLTRSLAGILACELATLMNCLTTLPAFCTDSAFGNSQESRF